MLGIADQGTLESLVHCLVTRDAANALAACDQALQQGIEAGHLTEQLLAYWRDMLVAAVHGSAKLALHVSPEDWEDVKQRGEQLGPMTILAGAQILDQSLVRMRQSTHARILLEMAIIRICQLDQLDDLGLIIQQLRQGDGVRVVSSGSSGAGNSGLSRAPSAPPHSPAAAPSDTPPPRRASEKKKADLSPRSDSRGPSPEASSAGASRSEKIKPEETTSRKSEIAALSSSATEPGGGSTRPTGGEIDPRNVMQIWQQALDSVEDMAADFAACADRVAISAPNRLVVSFLPAYNLQKEKCERLDRKAMIEKALSHIVGSPVTIELRVSGDAAPTAAKTPDRSSRHRLRESERHELVQQVIELFDAEILRVEAARPSDPTTNGAS